MTKDTFVPVEYHESIDHQPGLVYAQWHARVWSLLESSFFSAHRLELLPVDKRFLVSQCRERVCASLYAKHAEVMGGR